MTGRPTAEQINSALARAADAAREHTKYPDRILKQPLPQHGSERRGERWWLIGYIRVLGQSKQWEVLYDPRTDAGRFPCFGSTRIVRPGPFPRVWRAISKGREQ
jgi:hypothetical protein